MVRCCAGKVSLALVLFDIKVQAVVNSPFRKGVIPENWKPIYDILVGIRNDLDKLSITQAWSLRETDLYDFQRQLDKIDESRVDGNWLDDEGKPAELYVQRVGTRAFVLCRFMLIRARLSSTS